MTQELERVPERGHMLMIEWADETKLAAAMALAGRYKTLVVADEGSYHGANEALREIATMTKNIEADRKEKKAPILTAGKELDAQYADADRNLREARAALERSITVWRNEENRKRVEAQRRAAELAEKERKRLEARADRAAEKGDVEKANALEQQAQYLAESVQAPAALVDKAEGVSGREVWKFEIVNEDAIPRQYMTPDLQRIGAYAKAMKQHAEVPGIRFYAEETSVVKGL